MYNTISNACKSFENKDGKGYLFNETGMLLAVFDGEINRAGGLLYVVQNEKMYNIIHDDNGEYHLEKY